MPSFGHPAAFWALLGVPALVAIHCLQQRSRTVVTSTLFLLDLLAPESRGGRHWDWLRLSRAFWCQLLALLLAIWVLAAPRWVRNESAQTVVAVLDSSAQMGAFRDAARHTAAAKLAAAASRAMHTEWVVLTSDPRQPPLYRGPDLAAAEAALDRWRPALGTHDVAPALQLARNLAGPNGLTWFVTRSRDQLPAGQPAVGVGQPLANAGFAGLGLTHGTDGPGWRALVRNFAGTPQQRTWWIEGPNSRSPEQPLTLAPGALVEITGRFPAGDGACTLVLSADEFAADDRLPLVRPVPKPLRASVEVGEAAGDFFRRLLAGVEGVAVGDAAGARLRVLPLPSGDQTVGAAILLPPAAKGAAGTADLTPITAERHPLVADLNWQGWLGPGPGAVPRLPGDAPLLWQGTTPLVWLRPGAEDARQLVLNFDWDRTNAARLPATVLLGRRFVEGVRDAQPGGYAANFDTGAPVPLTARDRAGAGPVTLAFQPAAPGEAAVTRTVEAGELAVLRAPDEPGFFTVQRGPDVLVRGATQFADARQGDFRTAETFDTGLPPEAAAALERNTRPDPLENLWLALLAGLLLGSWWPGRRAGS